MPATPLKRTGHCMLCVHRTESDGCSPLHCRPVKPLLSVQPVQAYAGPPAEQAGVVLSEPRHTHHLAALRAGRSWPAHHLRANGSMPQRMLALLQSLQWLATKVGATDGPMQELS